jgi:hypothetical protein
MNKCGSWSRLLHRHRCVWGVMVERRKYHLKSVRNLPETRRWKAKVPANCNVIGWHCVTGYIPTFRGNLVFTSSRVGGFYKNPSRTEHSAKREMQHTVVYCITVPHDNLEGRRTVPFKLTVALLVNQSHAASSTRMFITSFITASHFSVFCAN